MFDIGFSELFIVGVVALIVIGPERLPKVARTAGLLLGRLRRYVSDVKADINREIQLDELKNLQRQVATEARSMESSVSEQLKSVETSLNQSIADGIGQAEKVGPAGEALPAPQAAPPADKPSA